jgi:hypothetical protein
MVTRAHTSSGSQERGQRLKASSLGSERPKVVATPNDAVVRATFGDPPRMGPSGLLNFSPESTKHRCYKRGAYPLSAGKLVVEFSLR